jgi:SOS-response transcriptional repressor LexA
MFDRKEKMNFKKIMQRVATIIELENRSAPFDKEIAYALGLTPTQYANAKKRNSIPYKEIALFCDEHAITINWVLLGNSSMKLIENEENIYKIRLIEKINASCGGGGYCDEEAECKSIYIDRETADQIGVIQLENYDAINVIGDSMIPTIEDKSIVLVDRTKQTLEGSGVYIVNTTAGLFVKRLHKSPNGEIELISDNRAYPAVTMLEEEMSIVGRVVGSLDNLKRA